jgi:AI-2E family transporter
MRRSRRHISGDHAVRRIDRVGHICAQRRLAVVAFFDANCGGAPAVFPRAGFLFGRAARFAGAPRFAVRRARLQVALSQDHERHRENLAGYLLVVTMINTGLGVIVAVRAMLLGFPNPAIFGLLAALLNYAPYVGRDAMVCVLFGLRLVTFPSLGHALLAPISFVALTVERGTFHTPTIVGRRNTLNPLLILLALAFWTWMWRPIGDRAALDRRSPGIESFVCRRRS